MAATAITTSATLPAFGARSMPHVGAVYVFLATARSGPAYSRTITIDTPAVDAEAQAGAAFGSSLFNETIQYDPDPGETFVVGAPRYDVTVGGGSLLTEADLDAGEPEPYDRFGTALAENDLIRAIGALARP